MPRCPRLIAISAHGVAGLPAWRAWCAVLDAEGVDALLVRERERSDAEVLELATAARATLATTRLLIHRRFDVALACAAAGVHLPASGVPASRIRPYLGGDRLIGRSTHTIEEVDAARDEGVDYVVFGPVYSTPSKEGLLEPRGLDRLAEACRRGVPVVAVGGLDAERARAAYAVGATGVAAIRAFSDRASATELVGSAREAAA